jgi:hypothetical protein
MAIKCQACEKGQMRSVNGWSSSRGFGRTRKRVCTECEATLLYDERPRELSMAFADRRKALDAKVQTEQGRAIRAATRGRNR